MYIAMAGLHQCLPSVCEEFESYDDAVDFLADLHELGRERKKRLKKDGYLELNLHGSRFPYLQADGNEYCEIVEED